MLYCITQTDNTHWCEYAQISQYMTIVDKFKIQNAYVRMYTHKYLLVMWICTNESKHDDKIII